MIKTMNVAELKEKLDAKEDIFLIDCREQSEWDEGHIPGAVLMPLSEFEQHISNIPSDKAIIMQCRSGQRSLKACQLLLDHDYEDLTNLEGGILDWVDHQFEIEK